MSMFDKSNNSAGGLRSETVVFTSLPKSADAFRALPQAALATPFDTAALTVLALSIYPENREESLAMLNFLRGPRPLSPMDTQFIRDRFMDSDYVPRSYFKGAAPQNDYKPALPCSVTVSENPNSYQNEGYATLWLTSGGADSPRQVTLRKAKDGKWYLLEQYLLVGIRAPESENPWA